MQLSCSKHTAKAGKMYQLPRHLRDLCHNCHMTCSAIPLDTPPTSTIAPNLTPPYQESYPEPKVSLLEKFDGTRSQLRSFINQIRLILRLQPRRYATCFHWVNLLGSLFTGPTEAWFAPLVETASTLLEDFSAFLIEFEATFGETDR
jgi:hypothetical protein